MPYIVVGSEDSYFAYGYGSTKESALNNAKKFTGGVDGLVVHKCTAGVYAYVKRNRFLLNTSIAIRAGRFTLK